MVKIDAPHKCLYENYIESTSFFTYYIVLSINSYFMDKLDKYPASKACVKSHPFYWMGSLRSLHWLLVICINPCKWIYFLILSWNRFPRDTFTVCVQNSHNCELINASNTYVTASVTSVSEM